MKVVICENELEHREFLRKVISNYALFSEPSIEIVLIASQPEAVLEYIRNDQADCYFLDIELGASIDGMELARNIREQDPLANIVFVSMHADQLKLTFKYKLAALDFIVKEDAYSNLSDQVREALEACLQKYQQLAHRDELEFVQIKIGERVKNIPYNDIYYLASSHQPHKLVLYAKDSIYEFYGKMKMFENISDRFYRSHKSYIVNLYNVKSIDIGKRKIKMYNDHICDVSVRKIKPLQNKMKKVGEINEKLRQQCHV